MSDVGPFSAQATSATAIRSARARNVSIGLGSACALGFLVLPGREVVVALMSVACFAGAVGPAQRTGSHCVARLLKYVARSNWTKLSVSSTGQRCTICARGRSEVDLYEFVHRGRLDLSGGDRTLDSDMSALLERMAAEGGGTVTWHLTTSPQGSTSTLALPAGTRPARSHLSSDASAFDVASPWVLERWSYLRNAHEVMAIFSVVASRAQRTESVLRSLMPFGSGREASVVIHVVAAQRSNSVVGRHLHRWRANVALAGLGGFRQRASTDASTQLLSDRERDVALGRALCQVQVFITLRAGTRRELERAALALREDAHRVATRLERGNGRHALWLCAQLPGSPGAQRS